MTLWKNNKINFLYFRFFSALLAALSAFLIIDNSGRCEILKNIYVQADHRFQTIDGFGVNITPAQWRNGNLKKVIDRLVDDLGCTLFRFDCTGKADWLDPAKRDVDGHYPFEYLEKVYNSSVFKDAWETFRYLTSKKVNVFFNISGAIQPGIAGPDGKTLVDYDGYAEMAVTLLKWAREKEHLSFTYFSPFNETDLGYPEGPALSKENCVPALKTVIKKLDQEGFGDLKIMAMDDSNPNKGYLESILADKDFENKIACFATHFYGNGGDEDWGFWSPDKIDFKGFIKKLENTPFSKCPYWLTEYGDLDQTGEVEYGVAWRSTRRLLKCLNNGVSAGLAWDAFDNLHEHDGAWATYGLLKTDQQSWNYSEKSRYFSAKQVYRFVRPGFQRVELKGEKQDPKDVYATWHNPLKHFLFSAFVSPDGDDFTIVGMSTIEDDVKLHVDLSGLSAQGLKKTVYVYRTAKTENCVKTGDGKIESNSISVMVKENSIFTITTVQ